MIKPTPIPRYSLRASLRVSMFLLAVFSCLIFSRINSQAESPAQQFRVAVLYHTKYGDEYNNVAEVLNWKAKTYSINELDQFYKELDQYDMVLATPLYSGKEGPEIHSANAAKWKKFIENGGALVIPDSNYMSTIGWLEAIDPTLKIGVKSQASLVPEALAENTPVHRVHRVPNPVLNPGATWANLDIAPESAWEVVTRRMSGAPVTAFQRYGKGFVYLTNLRIQNAHRLENLATTLKIQRLGLTIESFGGSEVSVGENKLSLGLKAFGDADVPVELEFEVSPQEGAPVTVKQTATIRKGKVTDVELPYHVSLRGAASAKFTLTSGSTSSVLFQRDIVLPKLLTVESARYRGVVAQQRRSEKVQIGVKIAPDREDLNALRLTTDVVDSTGKVRDQGREFKITGKELPLALPFPKGKYNVGKYVLRTRLWNGQQVIADESTNLEVLAGKARQVIVDEDMATLFGGRPFFPIGLYHVNKGDIPVVAKVLGINTVQAWWKTDLNYTRSYLDEAHAHGIKVLMERGNKSEEDLVKIINEFKGHIGVLGWYVVDEPNEDKYPDAIRIKELYKEHDIDHPTFMVSFRPTLFHKEKDLADIFAVDPYLKDSPKATYRPATKVSDWISWAWKATKNDKPVWAVPESFGFTTPEESRITTYLSVIHQAKAVIWYPWDDGKQGSHYYGLKFYPELWPVYRQMVVELNTLAPGLLSGKLRTFVEGPFHGLVVEHADGNYLLLANSSKDKAQGSVKVPEIANASVLKAAFAEGERQVKGEDVALDMEPYQVDIYRW